MDSINQSVHLEDFNPPGSVYQHRHTSLGPVSGTAMLWISALLLSLCEPHLPSVDRLSEFKQICKYGELTLACCVCVCVQTQSRNHRVASTLR